MKTLLYFEEYESDLSKALRKRKDINVLFIRTDKNIRFFSNEYLEKYKDYYQFFYYNDFDMEIHKFKNWLSHKKIKIDYFLNDSEFYMEYSNKIAERLGLECLSSEQVKWVRDKVAMKDKFNQIGLRTVDYQIVTSKNDILKFMKKHIGEPIIFKPRDLMNSKNVFKIDSPNDLDQIDLNLECGKYMVESYCYDQEWSIESLVQDGMTSWPPLPMMRPGREVQTVMVMSFMVRSMTMRETLDFARRTLRYLRSLESSSRVSPYFLPPYQLESHPRITPKRLLIGFTFCPIC